MVAGSDQRIFLIIVYMPRERCFFWNESEKTGGIVLNELRFSGPGEIAFEAHQRSIHRRWFQTESDLEIVSIKESSLEQLDFLATLLFQLPVPIIRTPLSQSRRASSSDGKEILSASLFVPSYPLLFFSLLVFALITFS